MAGFSPELQSASILRALEYAHAEGRAEGGVFVSTGSVQRTASGWTVVVLQQTHAGIPVLSGVRAVRFDPEGEPVRFTGRTIEVPEGTPVMPRFSASEAAFAAFLALLEEGRVPRDLAFDASPPEVVVHGNPPSSPSVLRKEPFVDPILASLVVEVDGGKARLLWEVRLGLPAGGRVHLVRTTAGGRGRRPRVRVVRRLSAHAIEGLVHEWDPRTERVVRPFPRPRDDYPHFDGGEIPSPEWVASNRTRGNNTEVRDSANRTVRGVAAGGDLRFAADEGDVIEQGMVNAFYLCNLLHDFFLLLGFDERAGNFQDQNAPGIGGGGDSLLVVVRDEVVDGLAFFSNRPDGTRPVMELGSFLQGRHTALDADIVIHEFVHGVTNRIIGGKSNALPLEHQQSEALGEGLCDYFALSIQNYYRRKARREADPDADEAAAEEWVYAKWLTGRPTGLRTASYEDYPNGYGFLRKGRKNAHTAGEVWCATLLDVNRELARAVGDRDRGDELGWRLVFDSLPLLHPGPGGPTFLHARDALFCAYRALVAAGTLPADPTLERAVCEVFRRRGMGGGAKSKGARFKDAVAGEGKIEMDTAGGCA